MKTAQAEVKIHKHINLLRKQQEHLKRQIKPLADQLKLVESEIGEWQELIEEQEEDHGDDAG